MKKATQKKRYTSICVSERTKDNLDDIKHNHKLRSLESSIKYLIGYYMHKKIKK